jgi:hypothetical protein
MAQLVKINCLSFEKEKEVIAFRYKIPNSGVIYHISEGGMDEGTLKTPIPKCRLLLSLLFGVVKQFFRF